VAPRLALLVKYAAGVASSRVRWHDVVPDLERSLPHEVLVLPLFPGQMRKPSAGTARRWTQLASLLWTARNAGRRLMALLRLRPGDAVVIQKFALATERLMLARLGRRGVFVVFDLDDAEWLTSHRRERALRDLARRADVACGGSPAVCTWLSGAGARSVELIPTPVEVQAPDRALRRRSSPVLLWTGSPASSDELRRLVGPLDLVHADLPAMHFRVVGSGPLDFAPPWWELVEWTPEGEASELAGAACGVMPLEDTAFNAGKCAFKALLYAGAGVLVVASPVGVNAELLSRGLGIAAGTDEEWVEAIELCLADAAGPAGDTRRATAYSLVAEEFSRHRYVERLAVVIAGGAQQADGSVRDAGCA